MNNDDWKLMSLLLIIIGLLHLFSFQFGVPLFQLLEFVKASSSFFFAEFVSV